MAMLRSNSKLNPDVSGQDREDVSFGELGFGRDGAAERDFLLTVLARLIDGIITNREFWSASDELFTFIRRNRRLLGLVLPTEILSIDSMDDLPREERITVMREVKSLLPTPRLHNRSSLDLRLDFLTHSMSLAEIDRAILGILARRSRYNIWRRLVKKIGGSSSIGHVSAVALMTGYSEDEAYRAYSERGNLQVKGLAEEHCGPGIDLGFHDFIKKFIACDAVTDGAMIAALMPITKPSTLDAESFTHLARDFSRAQRLVSHSLQSGNRANILLYGLPGTGKTEFARLLADTNASTAISVGEADDEGGEPTRRERLGHLGVCRKLVANLSNAVLVIDEAEDLFQAGIEDRGSKLWLNKLVEDGKGPHVWIVNDPGLLGEPVVRRMDMAVRFDTPPPTARRRIVERMVAGQGAALGIDDANRSRLVGDLANLNTSPAILAAAMRTCAAVDGDTKSIIGLARDLSEAAGRSTPSLSTSGGAAFDPALSVSDCDLVTLADRLADARQTWSLLLSGPPGTGKSAYARYLADRAGIDLVCISGSELLGAFVGETEKQIAAAFANAERNGSLLLIDEADSFLANRDLAHRNWEVSMTNEMLRQIERGRVRFIATTNRAATLDPASARRFTLHANFVELDASRAKRLFEATFSLPAPADLDHVTGLTPGDFAQLQQRAVLLRESNPARLLVWLRTAVNMREGSKAKMGF